MRSESDEARRKHESAKVSLGNVEDLSDMKDCHKKIETQCILQTKNSFNQILPGDKSKWVPPDSIPNSEVKPFSANDSVG